MFPHRIPKNDTRMKKVAKRHNFRNEVHTVALMVIKVFWDVVPCRLFKCYHHYAESSLGLSNCLTMKMKALWSFELPVTLYYLIRRTVTECFILKSIYLFKSQTDIAEIQETYRARKKWWAQRLATDWTDPEVRNLLPSPEGKRFRLLWYRTDRRWGLSSVLFYRYRSSFRGVQRQGVLTTHLHLSRGQE